MTHLFVNGEFQSANDGTLPWKIDCDALTDDDWATIAYQYAQLNPFRAVYGIPTGGMKLATALEQYAQPDLPYSLLIVDDVLTTGQSMEEAREALSADNPRIIGLVLFSRMQYPPGWIVPVFMLQPMFNQ